MIGLHGGDNVHFVKTAYGLPGEVLGMLDAEAAVPLAVPCRRLSVDSKQPVVGTVADGVHADVQACGIG